MRPKRIRITNFGPFSGEHRFEFPDGFTIIHGRNLDTPNPQSNEAGKTFLLYAVVWALWGKLPARDFRVDDVVHHGAEDPCEVRLVLDSRHRELTICRTRTVTTRGKSGLWFRIGKGTKFDGDPGATQAKLEEYLGMDWKMFLYTCYLSPLSPVSSFWHMSGSARAALLSQFIDDAPYRVAAEKLKERIKVHDDDKKHKLGELNQLEVHREQIINTLTEVRKQLYDAKAAAKQRVAASRNDIEAIEREIASLQQELSIVNPPENEAAVRAYLVDVDKRLSELLQKQGALAQQSRQRVFPAGQQCPTCHQLVPGEHVAHLQQAQQKAQSDLYDLQQVIQQTQLEQNSARASLEHAVTYWRERKNKEQQVQDKQQLIFAIREGITTDVSQQVKGYDLQVQRYQEQLEMLNSAIETKSHEIRYLDYYLPILRILKTGFDSEIRNMLLDRVREIMQWWALRYLRHFCGERTTLEFKHQKESGKESFEIILYQDGKPLSLPSGGLTYRIAISLALALRQTRIQQLGKSLEFLFLDDPVSELDDQGCKDLSTLLLEMTLDDVPQILMTIPRDHLQLTANQELLVTRRGGKSTIGGY